MEFATTYLKKSFFHEVRCGERDKELYQYNSIFNAKSQWFPTHLPLPAYFHPKGTSNGFAKGADVRAGGVFAVKTKASERVRNMPAGEGDANSLLRTL